MTTAELIVLCLAMVNVILFWRVRTELMTTHKLSFQLDRANTLLVKCGQRLNDGPLGREIFDYFEGMPRDI